MLYVYTVCVEPVSNLQDDYMTLRTHTLCNLYSVGAQQDWLSIS